ncbi:MAG TPA: hypothetical protein VMM78_05630 [Thermomicrobiales bacterium]|nr:hypothetical protein [Thermomicrobiales bacterium]
MFKRRKRRAAALAHGRGTLALQVAAILIAIGAVMKLYQTRSRRADDSAFRRIRTEIDTLDISASGKDTLHDVTKLASELTSDARDEAAPASAS